jgi:anthranilate phosphoribosyltransferase
MPTVMNVLGPLTNPAGATRQVIGVADPSLLNLIAEALAVLGHTRALVVHGEPGMDELSPLGPTRIVELQGGETREWILDPREELGWEAFEPAELAGGGPEENAAIVKRILKGEQGGAPRAAVVLNAGAAVYVAGQADTLRAGVARAEQALDQGEGWRRLEALRQASNAR